MQLLSGLLLRPCSIDGHCQELIDLYAYKSAARRRLTRRQRLQPSLMARRSSNSAAPLGAIICKATSPRRFAITGRRRRVSMRAADLFARRGVALQPSIPRQQQPEGGRALVGPSAACVYIQHSASAAPRANETRHCPRPITPPIRASSHGFVHPISKTCMWHPPHSESIGRSLARPLWPLPTMCLCAPPL